MAKAKAVESKTLVGVAASVAASLNKKFKNSSTRVISGLTSDNVSNVKDWISTGCDILNVAISNLPNGGFPCGRNTILYGPEQSGKSLLAMHAIAETQKKGGIALYVDAEHSLHSGFCEAIGVNIQELQILPSNEVEQVFDVVTKFIEEVRSESKDIPITVVIDSVAALVMADDMDADFTVKGYNTKRSIAFSNGLPKIITTIQEHNVCMIMTNQARYKLDRQNVYESPWKAPCGQALPHYASVVIFMQKAGTIKIKPNGLVRVIGRTSKCKIEKNRLGPPEITVLFDTYFDRGIDNYGSWAPYVEPFKLCKKSGAFYSYEYTNPNTGEVIEFKTQGWDKFCHEVLLKYPDIAHELWMKLYNSFKTTYRKFGEGDDFAEVIFEDVPSDPLSGYEVPFED